MLSAAFLVIMLFAIGGAAMTMGRFLTLTDSLSPADVIVVLGGDNGDFTRTQHAVQLFQHEYAPEVVFLGASPEDFSLTCSPPQRSLEVAQRLGLPADAAIIVHGARSTYDEAVQLHTLAEEHNWKSLIVITDPFHTRRVDRTFHTLLPSTTIYVSASPDPDYDAGRWWRTEDSLVSVFNEVIKLAFYWAKYGIAPIGI